MEQKGNPEEQKGDPVEQKGDPVGQKGDTEEQKGDTLKKKYALQVYKLVTAKQICFAVKHYCGRMCSSKYISTVRRITLYDQARLQDGTVEEKAARTELKTFIAELITAIVVIKLVREELAGAIADLNVTIAELQDIMVIMKGDMVELAGTTSELEGATMERVGAKGELVLTEDEEGGKTERKGAEAVKNGAMPDESKKSNAVHGKENSPVNNNYKEASVEEKASI